MKQTEEEIIHIKQAVAEMWQLVESQVHKSKQALLQYDSMIAHEVQSREKSVDSYELYIDRACENFIALFNPVAIDLRFVLSLMKINNNVERLGDFADGIAHYVITRKQLPLFDELLKALKIELMFTEVETMFALCKRALSSEDTSLAAEVFGHDHIVDEIHANASSVLASYCREHPEYIEEYFALYAAIRRIERMGDRCNNIAEDIIFYIDAKEIRHTEK